MHDMTRITEAEYLQERLSDQIDWYDRKSGWNQRWSKYLQIITLTAAGLIPFISGVLEEAWAVRLGAGALGVVVVIAAGIQGVFRFQERWIEYRTTAETLKHERYRYLTRSVPYDTESPFGVLVTRIESLISQENTRWQQQMLGRAGDPDEKNGE